MATEYIHVVLSMHRRLFDGPDRLTQPSFQWAEKIPYDQPFILPEAEPALYEPLHFQTESGKRWKVKLLQNPNDQEKISIIKTETDGKTARQHLAKEAKKRVENCREMGIEVEEKPSGMGDVDELDAFQYLVHEEIHLAGHVSKRTRY